MNALEKLRGKTIALVCPTHKKPGIATSDPFLLVLIGQIGDVVAQAGCELLIGSFPPGVHDWKARYIDSGRAEGILVLGEGHFAESIGMLERNRAPFVVWGGTSRSNAHYVVGSDNFRGGYIATRHLLELGRRRIVFLGYRHVDHPELLERYQGYSKALAEYEIAVNDKLILKPQKEQHHPTFAAINHQLIEANVDFDAIFAPDDVVAVDAIDILGGLGLSVPDDVSVIGFDDQTIARLCEPQLTTVTQDVNFGARELVGRLANVIVHGKTKSLRLGVKLVVRGSCTPNKDSRGKIMLRENGMIDFADKNTEKILGYTLQELIGNDFDYIMPDQQLYKGKLNVDFNIKNYFDKKSQGIIQSFHFQHKDGKILPLQVTVNRDRRRDGDHFVCILCNTDGENIEAFSSENFRESFERAVAERTEELSETALQMKKIAFEDSLTKVYNRRYFDTALIKLLKDARSNAETLSLAMFDVDFFKNYNDNYGHIAGDECLQRVAKILKHVFTRKSDFVARYGGEEFVAIINNANSDEALAIADHALEKIRGEQLEHHYSDVADFITLSCGLYTLKAEHNTEKLSPTSVLLHADKALYLAKTGGRNKVYVVNNVEAESENE